MFLAGACLADDVTAEAGTYEWILDEIADAAIRSPYEIQREYAAEISGDLLNSHYGDNVTNRFLDRLSDDDSDVRRTAASALVGIGVLDERVLDCRKGICEDYKLYSSRYVSDPEREGFLMPVHEWAFRTLWRAAGSE